MRQQADSYGAIKKLTCSEIGIPSQVSHQLELVEKSMNFNILLFCEGCHSGQVFEGRSEETDVDCH